MPKRRANGEGSIYVQKKDKNGKAVMWAASYTDNSGTRRTVYGKTQQIVKEKLKEAINQSDRGLQMDKNKMLFADWLKDWLEIYVKPVRRKSTYASYYHILYTHIIPAFPKVTLKDLRTDMLQKFFNEKGVSGRRDGRDGGVSVKYMQSMKTVIQSALSQAETIGIISNNPAKKVIMPPKVESEIEALTLDEQEKLEAAIANDSNPLSFIILLNLYSGLRIGELVSLKLDDINMDKKELYVRSTRRSSQVPGEGRVEVIEGEPKTKKSKRTVPLNAKIIEDLKQYLDYRYAIGEAIKFININSKEDSSNYLFVTKNGTVPEYTTVRAIFVKLLSSAGIRKINVHVLRHTFATRCMESGMDVKTLADILGHENVAITLNVYSHSTGEQKRKSIEKLSQLFEADDAD